MPVSGTAGSGLVGRAPRASCRAASYDPQALVIECMAVMPALQEINQSKLIRSTIGVLCNVREDHLAEMGPTLDDVARSLCRSMPEGGICVTAEVDRFAILQEEADARDCELIHADPETVSDAELRGFSWFTFKENVAIALKVAELLGVERETALQGMYDAPPDPGVLSVERYVTPDGKKLRFANVFAANDPESTLMNVNQLLDLGAVHRPLNVVINCRPDRVERNGQMGEIIPDLQPDKVFVIGHPAKSAIDAIPAEWRGRAVDLGGDRRDPEEFMRELLGGLGPDSSLIAIGNIHGQGELLLEHLSELPPDGTPDGTPDETPDGTPDEQSRETGYEQPGETPQEWTRETPDERPDPPAPQHVRHDETLPLQQYRPHLDPYAPYPEAYETRYQPHPTVQPPQPAPHQAQTQTQAPEQAAEQTQAMAAVPAPVPARSRPRGMFEPAVHPDPQHPQHQYNYRHGEQHPAGQQPPAPYPPQDPDQQSRQHSAGDPR
ncbi:poly-gamma-glutamate synthase PgsB [Streptomyces sp. ITFR-6]|uniref:poly-gamma-glutamate synthase PgsB n=1 Tax=Streptomyces sp. ITFR-6 TaxID=3075197 RepID=UPI00288A0442|nr:poly-gamma-glutamate synthase PgsB [Streptomyces sp. ITFR-6]WNI31426.1 poly-gamma-glutamate synthase PgsB [Streptomyces sp. ITFR-6]